MTNVQGTRAGPTTRIQIERFALLFQCKYCVQITMGKEYSSSDKMVSWLSGDFFKSSDKFFIDFTGAKTLCNVSTKIH